MPLTWPPDGKVDLDWIHHLMSALDWSSKNLPPSDFPSVRPVQAFDILVLTASKILHKEPSCLKIEPDEDSSAAAEVVVVGDFHGQYHDLSFFSKTLAFPPKIASSSSMAIKSTEALGDSRPFFSCWPGRSVCHIEYIFYGEIMSPCIAPLFMALRKRC